MAERRNQVNSCDPFIRSVGLSSILWLNGVLHPVVKKLLQRLLFRCDRKAELLVSECLLHCGADFLASLAVVVCEVPSRLVCTQAKFLRASGRLLPGI